MCSMYEIVIFTSSHGGAADEVISKMDEKVACTSLSLRTSARMRVPESTACD